MKTPTATAYLSCVLGCVYLVLLNPATAASPTLEWIEQFGTTSLDDSLAISADGLGNVYITGRTRGSLVSPNFGIKDGFVSKYDASGTLLWAKQLGTNKVDTRWGVSADGLGNVYISGDTQGSLGSSNFGSRDAFVSKYDASGILLWTEQLGTNSLDSSKGVSSDRLGNVYITGFTNGNLGGANAGESDAFTSKYDSNGNLLWTRQLGTSSSDTSQGVSVDRLGGVYITGSTRGSLGEVNVGDGDAFVSKYDANGSLLWTEQLGTSSDDVSLGVSADGLGNVYITGFTLGSLEGANAGLTDAFLAKFSDPIPEPSTLLLGAMAAVGLALRRSGDALHRG